jgi:hypothetical protein
MLALIMLWFGASLVFFIFMTIFSPWLTPRAQDTLPRLHIVVRYQNPPSHVTNWKRLRQPKSTMAYLSVNSE